MKRLLGCSLTLVLVLTARGPSAAPTAKHPTASPTKHQLTRPRLWVSARDGSRSVTGYIEPSGTGRSIRYDVKIEGPVVVFTVGERGPRGDLVGQSGAPLHGESLRTGYLDVPEGPDVVSFLSKSRASLSSLSPSSAAVPCQQVSVELRTNPSPAPAKSGGHGVAGRGCCVIDLPGGESNG